MVKRAAWFWIAALASCSSPAVQQQPPPQPEPVEGEQVSLLASPEESLVPDVVTYATAPAELRGFLYRPSGPGPFPAVIFNHGSEPRPGPKGDQAEFYVAHGYLLFVPHRRGHGRSGGEFYREPWIRSGRDPKVLVALLEAQVDDVAAAVAYLKTRQDVDGGRIAVAGCSFGGIETMLAAERDLGIRAAINFAGAAIMWARTRPLQERMALAARSARVPVFFLQAENDFDTSPSRVLAEEMRRAGRAHRIEIFPPHGTTPREGHSFCLGGAEPPWGTAVLAFLAETMK